VGFDVVKVKLYTWFERDRAHVELRNEDTEETIIEWRDDEVDEAIEDGFLDPHDYYNSAIETAIERGVITENDIED
jgi:hypothetical protein